MLGRILLFFVTCCWILFPSRSQIRHTYTIEDGLPSNTVYRVHQSKTGYLWICTDYGFSRYDGQYFVNMDISNGLPDNDILDLFEDSKMRIWLITLNGKVGYIEDHVAMSFSEVQKLQFNTRVTGISEMRDGSIFFTSLDGEIYHYHEDKLEFIANSFDQIIGSISHNDKLHVFTPDLFVFDEGKFLLLKSYKSASTVYKMAGYRSDLYTITPSTDHLRKFTMINDMQFGHEILQFKYDNRKFYNVFQFEGLLYLAANNGIFAFDGSDIDLIYGVQNATGMIRDNFGGVWISSLTHGLVHLNHRGSNELKIIFSVESLRDLEVSNDFVFVIMEDKINIYDRHNKLIEEMTLTENTGPAASIYVDNHLNRWIGYLAHFSIDDLEIIRPGFRSISESSGYYFATNSNFIETFDKSVFLNSRRIKIVDTIKISGNKKTIPLNDSVALIANDKGLFQWINDDISFYKPGDERTRVRINDLIVWGDSTFVATDGQGLLCMNENEIRQFTIDDGLSSNSISRLLFDGNRLWMGTRQGLNKLESYDNGFKIDLVTVREGLPSNNIIDIVLDGDRILVGTDQGVVQIPQKTDFSRVNNLIFFLSSIHYDDKIVPLDRIRKFPHDVGVISLFYTSIAFEDRQSIRYRFEIVDGEGQIVSSKVSNENNLVLTNPRSGLYTVKAQVRSHNTPWSKPVNFDFEVDLPVWQRLWFYLLGFFIFGIITIVLWNIFDRARTLQLSKLNAELNGLRAQINPHFLFNSLNSINHFILDHDLQKADNYLSKMGMLIRNVFRHSNQTFINLNHWCPTKIEKAYVKLESDK